MTPTENERRNGIATDILTEREAAQWVRMRLPSFRSVRYRGLGPREYRLGRHVRFRHSDLEAWLEQWTSEPASDRSGDAA